MVSVKRLRPLADPTPRDSVQSRICCPELFRTRRATPGSSGHVGYSEGNGPPQARQRYLKASSSERKDGDTILKWEWNALKQKFYIEKKREKERKKAKIIEKPEPENGERTEPWPTVNRLLKEKGTTHLCIHLMPLDRSTPTTRMAIGRVDRTIKISSDGMEQQ